MIGKASSNSFEILNLIIKSPICKNLALYVKIQPYQDQWDLSPVPCFTPPTPPKKKGRNICFHLFKLSDTTLGT